MANLLTKRQIASLRDSTLGTEVRRLARDMIKDHIKLAGGKISHYDPRDIANAANQLIASPTGTYLLAKAKQSLGHRRRLVAKLNKAK